jgi:hypothetical protein
MEYYSISFNYSFSSGLGAYEHSRYVQEIFLGISLDDEYGNKKKEIGSAKLLVFLIEQAWNSRYSLYEIIDAHSEYAARHIFKLFDAGSGDYAESVNEYYNYDVLKSNICLIEKIAILPEFRGYKIGAKAIKDILFHYSSACGLFAIQPYPLQFELDDKKRENTRLGLEKLEQNKAKAFRKLTSYYKSIGFESVPGIKDLLLYNPALINKKLDKLDLEETPKLSKLAFI